MSACVKLDAPIDCNSELAPSLIGPEIQPSTRSDKGPPIQSKVVLNMAYIKTINSGSPRKRCVRIESSLSVKLCGFWAVVSIASEHRVRI
ncbi:hypothetical protein D3C71_2064740 [compost metagenome]